MIAVEKLTLTEGTFMEANIHSNDNQVVAPSCYSLTLFTQKWEAVKEFYTGVLGAEVISERTNRYCDMELGGLALSIRPCEFGENVSFVHIYLAMQGRDRILELLRQRGVIVTFEGPYANFRDPEGRVFKLSESEAIVA